MEDGVAQYPIRFLVSSLLALFMVLFLSAMPRSVPNVRLSAEGRRRCCNAVGALGRCALGVGVC